MGPRAKGGSEITTPPPVSVTPPAHVTSSSNHDFFLQSALHTERSIGELKATLEVLGKSSEKHGAKFDSLNETVHTAQGFLKAITILGSIFGAIGLALLAAILKMLADHFSKG